jgi:hypothetical protein
VALDEFKESLKTFLDDPSSNETLFWGWEIVALT